MATVVNKPCVPPDRRFGRWGPFRLDTGCTPVSFLYGAPIMAKRLFTTRWPWQLSSTLLGNAYLGFLSHAGLYRGFLKNFCFPGLNCYSCPAATGACPLGSLQQALASMRLLPSLALPALSYVLGWLLLFGLLLGRFICGWLCPFGFLQELLHKIPLGPKKKAPRSGRFIKHVFLWALVLILPVASADITGYGKVWFCRLFCPAGTLEAGIFNLGLRPEIHTMIGTLFYGKLLVLIGILIGCIIYLRLFCALFCPLGCLYGLLQRWGCFKIYISPENCSSCGLCEKVCPMNLKLPDQLDSNECIRCLNCMKICPTKGIRLESLLLPHTVVDHPQRTD